MDENMKYNENGELENTEAENAEIENAADTEVENTADTEACEIAAEDADAENDTADGADAENSETETPGEYDELAAYIKEQNAKKKKAWIAPVAVIACVIIIAAAVLTSMVETNKYNKLGYVDVTGKTIQDLIDENGDGMTLKEFLEYYELPEDMPADTTESAAYYMIPIKKVAEMNGASFELFKEVLQLPDTVTEDTPWGEAEDQITLRNHVGEEAFENFKTTYGLGDEITLDSLWKDVRKTVEEKQKQDRIESENAQKAAADEAEKNTQDSESGEQNAEKDAE